MSLLSLLNSVHLPFAPLRRFLAAVATAVDGMGGGSSNSIVYRLGFDSSIGPNDALPVTLTSVAPFKDLICAIPFVPDGDSVIVRGQATAHCEEGEDQPARRMGFVIYLYVDEDLAQDVRSIWVGEEDSEYIFSLDAGIPIFRPLAGLVSGTTYTLNVYAAMAGNGQPATQLYEMDLEISGATSPP